MIGSIVLIGVWIIVPLIFFAGMIWLQVFLSKNRNKWLGLILPIIFFAFSLVNLLSIMDTGDTFKNIVLIIGVLLLSNIPTLILLIIYWVFREKIKHANELDKMNIQDLE